VTSQVPCGASCDRLKDRHSYYRQNKDSPLIQLPTETEDAKAHLLQM
jgi:hypothetical protein